jgi:hypothetical protein
MCAHDITHYLPIPGQSVTYRHNVHVQSLRTCLFSSDAAQWWPGVWGWTGPAGHGLDKGGAGLPRIQGRGGPWGSAGGRVQA